MEEVPEVKKILKSEGQAILLMAISIFLCVLLLVIYFVFVKNKIDNCFPNFLILIFFSASIALFIFGGIEKAKSTGSFTGKLFGMDVTFSGPAAFLLIMVLIGREFIPCNPQQFDLKVNVLTKAKMIDDGSVMLTCRGDDPKISKVYNGLAVFRNLPVEVKGTPALLRPEIPGFENFADSILIPMEEDFFNYYPKPDSTEFHGNVVEQDNRVVKNCKLDFENGLAIAYSDSFGNFRTKIPKPENTQLILKIYVGDVIRYDNPVTISSQTAKTLTLR